MRWRVVVIFFFFAVNAGAALGQAGTKQYCNNRYGYCLAYFPKLLARQPEAQNGDGCTFTDAAGDVKLSVYGTGNWTYSESGSPLSLRALYELELRGGPFSGKSGQRAVTYAAISNNWFVLSGTEQNALFYMKVVQKSDIFCYARLRYRAAESAKYKATATLIARTFR